MSPINFILALYSRCEDLILWGISLVPFPWRRGRSHWPFWTRRWRWEEGSVSGCGPAGRAFPGADPLQGAGSLTLCGVLVLGLSQSEHRGRPRSGERRKSGNQIGRAPAVQRAQPALLPPPIQRRGSPRPFRGDKDTGRWALWNLGERKYARCPSLGPAQPAAGPQGWSWPRQIGSCKWKNCGIRSLRLWTGDFNSEFNDLRAFYYLWMTGEVRKRSSNFYSETGEVIAHIIGWGAIKRK